MLTISSVWLSLMMQTKQDPPLPAETSPTVTPAAAGHLVLHMHGKSATAAVLNADVTPFRRPAFTAAAAGVPLWLLLQVSVCIASAAANVQCLPV
jgi:hypothetical protein